MANITFPERVRAKRAEAEAAIARAASSEDARSARRRVALNPYAAALQSALDDCASDPAFAEAFGAASPVAVVVSAGQPYAGVAWEHEGIREMRLAEGTMLFASTGGSGPRGRPAQMFLSGEADRRGVRILVNILENESGVYVRRVWREETFDQPEAMAEFAADILASYVAKVPVPTGP